jgi:UDP-glucose 4-epimerase
VVDSLVIGANGFLGSHVVDALVGAGHEVTAFDRFRSTPPAFSSEVRMITGDFLSRGDLEAAVVGQDNVFHLLSTTTPATAESDPTLDVRTNVAQTVELLEACVEAGVSHVYFASTGGAIYGSQGLAEYAETDRALPVSPYAIGKLTIEHYLHYFGTRYGLESTSLRISNPYGPRQRPNRRQGLIPIALRQIALGQPVTQFGDGEMVRDYLYSADLVTMLMAMVGTPNRFDLYNIGSGVGNTVIEVFDALRRVTGRDFEVVTAPQPPTFVDRVVLNIDRFTSEFGAVDFTPLDEGIALTWRDMEEARGA